MSASASTRPCAMLPFGAAADLGPEYAAGEWHYDPAAAAAAHYSHLGGRANDYTFRNPSRRRCYKVHAGPPAEASNATWVAQKHASLGYTWRTRTGCRVDGGGDAGGGRSQHRMRNADAALGPTLWVGDSLLEQLFVAWTMLTGGQSSTFHKAHLLTNSWTLEPMTPQRVAACGAFLLRGGPRPSAGEADAPCMSGSNATPSPLLMSYTQGNPSMWHASMRWTNHLTFPGKRGPWRTIVLSTGHHFWREAFFPSDAPGCRTKEGRAAAFRFHPRGVKGCDTFRVKYPAMAANVARFVAASGFDGRVIFLTSPPGFPDCDRVHTPGMPRTLSSAAAEQSRRWHWQAPRVAELAWRAAFAEHAPRIRFATLNVTHLSELRGDARPPRDCLHYCLPGVPDVWARLLAQLGREMVAGRRP